VKGPISTIPPSLTGFWGIKGDNYWRGLSDEIVQQFAINELLTLLAREEVSGTVNMAAVGTGSGIAACLVPQGETWFVVDAHAQATSGGAEAIRLSLARINGDPAAGALSYNIAPESSSTVSGAAGAGVARSRLDRPLFLLPGSQLAVFVNNIVTAGNIVVTVAARIYRFRG